MYFFVPQEDIEREGEEGSDSDQVEWDEVLETKAAQLRALLSTLALERAKYLFGNGAIHADDEREIAFVMNKRGVATRWKVEVLTQTCIYVASLQQPDSEFVAEESQQSTESQLEREMLADEDRSHTPQGSQGSRGPDSLERLRAPPGTFDSPMIAMRSPSLQSSFRAEVCAGAPRVASPPRTGGASSSSAARGRPSELASAGRDTRQGLKEVSALSDYAPRKAANLLEEQRADAPEPTSHGNTLF